MYTSSWLHEDVFCEGLAHLQPANHIFPFICILDNFSASLVTKCSIIIRCEHVNYERRDLFISLILNCFNEMNEIFEYIIFILFQWLFMALI